MPNTGDALLNKVLSPVYNAIFMLQVATNDAAKAAGQYTIGQTDTVTGTVPKLVTVIALRAGTYSEVSATLGCSNFEGTATVTFYSGVTKLATITNTGIPAAKTSGGFTLTEATDVSVYLVGDTSKTVAFVYGIGVK